MLEELVFNQHTQPAQPIQAGQPHPGRLTLRAWGTQVSRAAIHPLGVRRSQLRFRPMNLLLRASF